jgi:hypothetical protein
MMRRVIMGLLVLGTVVGFGAGFARRHMGHRGHEQLMDRVADECVDAARRADRRDREGRRPPDRRDERRGDFRAERPDPR